MQSGTRYQLCKKTNPKALKECNSIIMLLGSVKFCDRNFMALLYCSINNDNSIVNKNLPPLPENWKDLYKDKLPEETLEIKKPKNPNNKRNKLAVKIFLAWAANLGQTTLIEHFDYALELADKIIKKLNQ